MNDSTYQTTSSSGGYLVNEDGTVTRIGGNGNSNNRNNSNRPNNNNQNDDNSWCDWGVIIAVIFIIAVILGIIGVSSIVWSDSNDTNYYDTVGVEEVGVVEDVVEDYRQKVYSPQTTNYLNLSTQTLNVPSSGGTYEISISTNGNWHVSVGTDNWGSITTYYNSISVRISPNNSNSTRSDYFEISAGGLTRRISICQQCKTNPSADIENIGVDNFVYQGKQYGIRIHVKFSVDNMKGKTVYEKAHFYYGDNHTLLHDIYGNNRVVSDYGTPNYDGCLFDDFQLFVPYTRLNMEEGIGSISLSFDISISTSGRTQLTRRDNTRFTFTS